MPIVEISNELNNKMCRNIWQTAKASEVGTQTQVSLWPVYSNVPIIPFWMNDVNNNPANYISAQIKCYFIVCKGVMPTSLSSIPFLQSRTSDWLIVYKNILEEGGLPHSPIDTITGLSYIDDNPIIINTRKVAATASGTATWFRLITWSTSSGVEFGTRPTHDIIGSIGKINSGADIEMETVDIVSGTQYSINNFAIQFKNRFVY